MWYKRAVRRRNRLEQLAGAHSAPALRTASPQRAGSAHEALRRQEKLVGRFRGGKFQVAGPLGKDVQDLVVGSVHSHPAFTACPGEVIPGHGVLFFIHAHQLCQLSSGREAYHDRSVQNRLLPRRFRSC